MNNLNEIQGHFDTRTLETTRHKSLGGNTTQPYILYYFGRGLWYLNPI